MRFTCPYNGLTGQVEFCAFFSVLRPQALLMVQALERAGDHATNLAEEIHHLIEKRSLRHASPRSRSVLAETG